MASIQNLIPYIYHEKQQEGSMLCAQHALNSLLQGSYFSAPDLSEIARNLDSLEEGVREDRPEAASTNMDDTGFFSVQVLERALQVWGLTLVRWRSEQMKPYHEHPHTQMAFILNCNQHWYTLRRFGRVSPDPSLDPGEGHWFNLNSFLPEPEWVGKLYLGMFLHQAETEGYSIFAVVQSDPTAPLALTRTEADELALSIPEDATGAAGTSAAARGEAGPSDFTAMEGIEGLEDEDMELQAVLQASLMGGGAYQLPSQLPQPRMRSEPQPQPQSSPSLPFNIPIRSSTTSENTQGGSGVRTPTRTPRPRRSNILMSDEEEEGLTSEPEQIPVSLLPPQPPAPAPPRPREPFDAIEASRRRNQALMEAFTRQQQFAMQETYEEEQARIEAGLQPARRRTRAEEEEEELRLAIEESRRLHEEVRGDGDAGEVEEERVPTSRRSPSIPTPRTRESYEGHRVYDDDDAELQAALKASLETVPEGFRVPSTPPMPPVSSLATTSAVPLPSVPTVATPATAEPEAETETETESEVGESPVAERAPVVDVDEMRRRRLARFGGS